jgi:hypothetical protein
MEKVETETKQGASNPEKGEVEVSDDETAILSNATYCCLLLSKEIFYNLEGSGFASWAGLLIKHGLSYALIQAQTKQ